MPNVHTPERQPNEPQSEYRARQAMSRAVAKTVRKGPTQAPAISVLDVSRFFLGQHTNPERNKRRAAIKASGGIRQFKKLQRVEA